MNQKSIGMSAKSSKQLMIATLLGTTVLAGAPSFAQDAPDAADESNRFDTIIVTANRREESLQDVPISVQALGEDALAARQVSSSEDYVKLLPSVSYQSFGPGQNVFTVRGVSTGTGFFHIGSLPTTGVYLDEIPTTTVGGNIDLHIYDVERVEALSGPQGTLFGASSLAGTLRVITNKPSTEGLEGGADLELNKFGDGEAGGTLEGYINIPLSDRVALRAVGFYRRDGGYIDNVPQTRVFTLGDSDPSTNFPVDNSDVVEDDYNDVETVGGRIALRIDLDEQWTVTPAIILQDQVSNGAFLVDPRRGDLAVSDFIDAQLNDFWYQAALTVEGKIGNWDLVYSGGYFERDLASVTDYSYYTVAYDGVDGGNYTNFPDGSGGLLDPTQFFDSTDDYFKHTHEIRISSPVENRLRVLVGAFYQDQEDDERARYTINGIAGIPTPPASFLIPVGPQFGDTVFLRSLVRSDTDYAIFGEANFDLTDDITLTGGIRGFRAENSLLGFSGFNGSAVADNCVGPATDAIPCVNVDSSTKEDGYTYRLSASWKVTPDALVYFTNSTGFRPGGNNRRQGILPFQSDTLTNYELGWKTTWADGAVRFNGALFHQDWNDIQINLTQVGDSGISNTFNAGKAVIDGFEADLQVVQGNWTFGGGLTYLDARLDEDFCQFDATGNPVCVEGVEPAIPTGTPLPVSPDLKFNATIRNDFTVDSRDVFFQASVNYQSDTRTFLPPSEFAAVGPTEGFATVDLAAGIELENVDIQVFMVNVFDERGELNRSTVQCAPSLCAPFARSLITKPRFFGIKFGTDF